jgi:4-hydroxythreonine-4-phosphate dehydrogenase
VPIHPIEAADREAIRPGELSVEAGEIGYRCVAEAVAEALAGRIDVISTASLNKTALRMAGRGSNGHAGILADLTGVKKAYAVLACPQFSVIHVSTHVSLARASELCRTDRVLDTIRAADHHMRTAGFDRPRVVVAGLNPHCGEGRLYGTEDEDEVVPAVRAAQAEGIEVAGPVPGDVVFQQAIDGKHDIVVAQFHDQGHIAAKLIGHHDCVNVTAGLPVLRTSVDHGTAFDIAWKGVADPSNMRAALAMARRMKPIDR